MDRAELARCAIADSNTSADRHAPDSSDRWVRLRGAYVLVAFDASGERATDGRLEWDPPSPDSSSSPEPGGPPAAAQPLLVGFTDIDLTRVGASVPGDPASRDPAAPGVALYPAPGGGPFVRVGSESNRRDRLRFDGAHTTLTITSIGSARFGGTWRSDVGVTKSTGSFCAKRLSS